jgi:glycosyltransferase involved in cell wall biosynthesis
MAFLESGGLLPHLDLQLHQSRSARLFFMISIVNMNNLELNYPIIVHCHLRWEGVWQRPQQFLSRLSQRHQILFIEGPHLRDSSEPPGSRLRQLPDYPNITVMHTEFPASRFADGTWVDQERFRLLNEALQGPLKGKFDRPVQWFYDPMAVPAHIDKLNERAVVYDCMDELSQFKFAPPEIISRERQLLARADLVFAGGRRMCQSKSRFNSNCHFYGCGVDVQHFNKARSPQTEVPRDIRFGEGKFVLGYFGVVDERLDYNLIGNLAAANPNWHIVIVGPTCKVDPDTFPQAPNLHWLGRREYAQLPSYVKGWDLCLMPFAMNEATEFINPTKALEYMATGTPIVSTPVPDVVSNFGSVVKIAATHEEFIDLCRKETLQPDESAISRGIQMAQENQWETIVEKLEGHIEDVFRSKHQRARTTDSMVTAAIA